MSDTSHCFNGVKFLGQEIAYPKTLWGALSVLIVVAGLCVIVFFVVVKADPRNVTAVLTLFTGRVAPGGSPESIQSGYLIQFWTPSAKTKTARAEDVDAWEKIDSDDRVVEFGNLLRDDKLIYGFRRYEVTGTGLRGLKSGYWWVVSADQRYQLSTFMGTYRSFWKNDKSIYMEVLREGGVQRNH
jgi:hypothetical protein